MRRWCLLLLIVLTSNVFAEDTLYISLDQAEKRFLDKNLLLLAAQYHVDIQRAGEIQARLWANPVISGELNAYNPERDKFFDVGSAGQKIFAVEQLILLGGKRRKQVALAKQQSRIAQFEFEDLLRNLRYELRTSFYSIFYDLKTLERYTRQLDLLNSIIVAYETQSQKGNIPLKEVLRLKAAYYQLNNDKTQLIHNILNEQVTLRLLLGEDRFIHPDWNESMARFEAGSLEREVLVDQALSLRPDVQETKAVYDAAQLNYKVQRSLAVPDVTLGGAYDQRGGAFQNQIGLTLAMDLPMFNRNQGNIRASRIQTDHARALVDLKTLEVRTEVSAAIQKLVRTEQEYQHIDKSFTTDFEQLNEGVMLNFQKRNLSLLEFVDFFESYNNNLLELNRLRKARVQSYEELNAIVGTELFNQ